MPIARFQAPDGRIMRFEVPEGTSEEDLFAAAQKQLGISTDVDFDDPLAVDIIKGLGSGAIQAVANTAAGLQSATATALGDDPDNKFLQGLQSNAAKIRDFSMKVDKKIGLDRDFAESMPGQIAKGFGQMPVNILATAGGAAVGSLAGPGGTVAGGLLGGGLTMAGQMQTEAIMDAERTLKKKHADFTEEEKDKTAVSSLSYMTLGSIMEYAGVSKVIPKPLKKKIINFVNKKGALSGSEVNQITKSLKGEILRGGAFEGMTEAAQGQLLDGLAAATYDTDREQFTVDQLGNRFNEFIVGSVVGGGTTAVLGGADRLMSGEPLSGRKATEAVADETIKAQSPFTFEYQRLDFEGQPQTESGPISAATEEEARAKAVDILQRDKDADVDSLIIKPVIEVGTFQDIQNQKVEERAKITEPDPEVTYTPTGQEVIEVGQVDVRRSPLEEFLATELEPQVREAQIRAAAEGTRDVRDATRDDLLGAAIPPQRLEQFEISTSLPTSKKVTVDHNENLQPSLARLREIPDTKTKAGVKKPGLFTKVADTVADYSFFPTKQKRLKTNDKAEVAINFFEKNILHLHDRMPEETRARTMLWYDGANKLANDFARRYEISPEAEAGAIAVLSPQKDWNQNVSLAERVNDVVYNNLKNPSALPNWNKELEATSKRIWNSPRNKKLGESIKGKSYNELTDPVEKAAWIRTYDETYNDRGYSLISPEGGILDRAKTQKGMNRAAAWGSTNEISKAVDILDNAYAGTFNREYLANNIGLGHKVRNFYNNIAYPNSKSGHVTIDTHAVAGAAFLPVGGNAKIVNNDMFGGNTASVEGIKGTYPLYFEAYQRAAQKRGILPRQMQSIVWEQVRTLFTDGRKTKPNLDFTENIWKTYSKGNRTYESAVKKIEDKLGGYSTPESIGSTAGLDAGQGHSTYSGQLSSVGVPGPELQTGTVNGRRAGGDPSATLVGARQQTASQIKTFDRIREAERAQAKMTGREYIPSTDAELMRALERTRIPKLYERFVGASTTGNLSPEVLNVIGKPMMQIKKLAKKLNIEIVEADSLPRGLDAAYDYTNQTIQYVPELLAGRGAKNAMAAMREEIIHAAMHQVILRKADDLTPMQAFTKTMESIGNALTTEQRERISQVYGKELSLTDAGAEYTRFVVQQMLYGETTEGTMLQGSAFQKVVSLIKSIHSLIVRSLKSDLQTNDEVAQIIKQTADLVAAADPSAKVPYQKQVDIANQKVVEQQGQGTLTAENVADPTELDPEKIVKEREKIFGNMGAKDYFYTPSRILQDISPKLYEVFQVWQQAIASKTLEAKQLGQPFFSKLEGIKNTADKEKLYRYLAFSPTQEEAGTTEAQSIIRERNRLMEKYDLYNEFNLIIRPLFNRIYEERKSVGMEEGFLFEYFPRVIKDMSSYLAYLGNDIRNDFKTYLSEVNAKRNEDNKASIDINTPLAGVIYGDYIKSDRYKKLRPKLSSSEQRKVSFIDEDAMKYYYTPAESFVRYIDSSYKAIENTKLLGNVSGSNLTQTGLEEAISNNKEIGRLGRVVMELSQDPSVNQAKLFLEVPYITNIFLTPSSNPTVDPFGMLNSAMYGVLMVEPTSTLSNAYELAFSSLDNGLRATIGAMLGKKTMTLDDIGVDKRQFSAEYNPDAKGLQKLVAKGLELTGFRRMDQFIKESTLTANYNRYRRAALKSKDSSDYKKLIAEIDFRMPSLRDKIIYDLRNNTPRSPEVRAFLFTKLAETQPISDLEMPAIVKKYPALRVLYVMKTFIVKQANFVFQRYFSVMANPNSTLAEKAKAAKDLTALLVYFILIGVPIDALKDLLAGRDMYPNDYLVNSSIRMFGISKYNAYEFKRDPKAMVTNYFMPVSFQVPLDIMGNLQAFYDDESKGKPETLQRYFPFSDLLYYRYGPGVESQERKAYKKSLEGEFPVELFNF